jgi:putative ABC transport system permease protein
MMLLGISGCTALLVTGFGLKDSIINIANYQYDRIQRYDLEAVLSDAADAEKREELREELADGISDSLFIHSETVDIINGDLKKQVTLMVPEQTDRVDTFWHLYASDGSTIAYPGSGEAVLTKKMADKLHISVGDTLTVRDEDMQQCDVTITGIAENYVYNYIYLSEETYQQGFEKEPEYKRMCVRTPENKDVYEISASFAEHDDVLQITVTAGLMERISSMMDSLDAVVLLIIFCAGALAFIVLYNLTNINIIERIREIATIKVLGFYPMEAAQYVFRENMMLTAISALLGLLLGKGLHAFVMYNIDIDLIAFDVHISPKSYILSVLMTFVFALLVNFVMYFKLNKINMAESLKSIE